MAVQNIFFQSSLPRSGSTLFQNLVGQNPDFYVTPTSGVLELVYAAKSNFNQSLEFKAQDRETMETAFRSFCKSGMEGFFNAITEKPYVLDKSRGWGYHYAFLNYIYPNPKIIVLIRDLKDVFTSMEKNFRKNQHLDMSIVNHGQMTGTTTEKRVDIWANSQPVGMAIERLYQICKEKNDEKMLVIKYEDLCKMPTQTMQKVYNFLEVPYFEHNFGHIEQITQEDDEIYGIYGDHKIHQSLKLPPSQAKEILGKTVCDWIEQRFSWFYNKFRY